MIHRIATSSVYTDPYATIRDAWTLGEVIAANEFLDAREEAQAQANAQAERARAKV